MENVITQTYAQKFKYSYFVLTVLRRAFQCDTGNEKSHPAHGTIISNHNDKELSSFLKIDRSFVFNMSNGMSIPGSYVAKTEETSRSFKISLITNIGSRCWPFLQLKLVDSMISDVWCRVSGTNIAWEVGIMSDNTRENRVIRNKALAEQPVANCMLLFIDEKNFNQDQKACTVSNSVHTPWCPQWCKPSYYRLKWFGFSWEKRACSYWQTFLS